MVCPGLSHTLNQKLQNTIICPCERVVRPEAEDIEVPCAGVLHERPFRCLGVHKKTFVCIPCWEKKILDLDIKLVRERKAFDSFDV